MVAPATINSLAEPKYRKRPKQYWPTLQRTFTFPVHLIGCQYLPQKKVIFRIWWGSNVWPDPIQGWRTDKIPVIRNGRALGLTTANYELLHSNPVNVLQDSPWPKRDHGERPRAVAHVAPQYNWAHTHILHHNTTEPPPTHQPTHPPSLVLHPGHKIGSNHFPRAPPLPFSCRHICEQSLKSQDEPHCWLEGLQNLAVSQIRSVCVSCHK